MSAKKLPKYVNVKTAVKATNCCPYRIIIHPHLQPIATQSPRGEGFVVTLRQAQGDQGERVEPSAERLGWGGWRHGIIMLHASPTP